MDKHGKLEEICVLFKAKDPTESGPIVDVLPKYNHNDLYYNFEVLNYLPNFLIGLSFLMIYKIFRVVTGKTGLEVECIICHMSCDQVFMPLNSDKYRLSCKHS